MNLRFFSIFYFPFNFLLAFNQRSFLSRLTNFNKYWKQSSRVLSDYKESEESYLDDNGYNNYIDEEEMIEKFREERTYQKIRWQSSLFRDQHCANWIGRYETYLLRAEGEDKYFDMVGGGKVETKITNEVPTRDGYQINFSEVYDSIVGITNPQLESSTRPTYLPADFTSECGNQVVANTYTLCKIDDNYHIIENAIRDQSMRVRCRALYAKDAKDSLKVGEDGLFAYALVGFTVIKEFMSNTSQAENSLLFEEEFGKGLYDPPIEGEPYISLQFPGRLSFLFPRGITKEGLQFLSMEWIATSYRFQIDRKFVGCDGLMKSIELTEIRIEDAEIYPPQHNRVEILK